MHRTSDRRTPWSAVRRVYAHVVSPAGSDCHPHRQRNAPVARTSQIRQASIGRSPPSVVRTNYRRRAAATRAHIVQFIYIASRVNADVVVYLVRPPVGMRARRNNIRFGDRRASVTSVFVFIDFTGAERITKRCSTATRNTRRSAD
jgi:hypothetical protein